MLRYIFIGSIFYVLFLVVTFPSNIAYTYWKQYLGETVPFQAAGLDGSIWSGQASSATINGQKIQPLKWSFQPLNLFLGQLAVDWEFTMPDGYGKGQAGYALLGGYYVKDMDAWVPVATIAPIINATALKPAGKLSVKLNSMNSDGKSITSANGSIEWHDAEVTLLKKMLLGSYHVDVQQEGDIISGVLSDKGGPIEASGDFTLTPEGDYQFDGLLSLRDTDRQDLRQALSTMGRPNREGKIKLSQKGNLGKLGIF